LRIAGLDEWTKSNGLLFLVLSGAGQGLINGAQINARAQSRICLLKLMESSQTLIHKLSVSPLSRNACFTDRFTASCRCSSSTIAHVLLCPKEPCIISPAFLFLLVKKKKKSVKVRFGNWVNLPLGHRNLFAYVRRF